MNELRKLKSDQMEVAYLLDGHHLSSNMAYISVEILFRHTFDELS